MNRDQMRGYKAGKFIFLCSFLSSVKLNKTIPVPGIFFIILEYKVDNFCHSREN